VALIQRMLKGRDPMVPDFGFPVVDVRDVVLAHVRALQDPSLIGQRLIVSAGSLSMPEMARLLKETYPDRKIPTRIAPKLLVRLLGLVMPEMRQLVSQLGHRQRVSNTKARQLLGIDFIPPDEALRATARDVIRLGLA
jgi:dihydroflavonol-4-reductase